MNWFASIVHNGASGWTERETIESEAERMSEGIAPPPQEALHKARYAFAIGFCSGVRVLDVACGTGYGCDALLRGGAREVVGCDYSTEALSTARIRTGDLGVSLSRADAAHLPFRDSEFDVCVSFETVEHLREPIQFVKELNRVCKPNGLLVLSTPNRVVYSPGSRAGSKPWNPFHMKEFTLEELSELLVDGGFTNPMHFGQLPGNPMWARLRDFLSRYKLAKRLMAAAYDRLKARREPSTQASPASDYSEWARVVRTGRGREPMYFIVTAQKRSKSPIP